MRQIQKGTLIKIIFQFFLISNSLVSISQDNLDKIFLPPDPPVQEEILINTDRFLYTTNETVKISAAYRVSPELGDISWSKVLYVELIDAGGTPFHQSKHPITGDFISLEIPLPGAIESGNYYLKAYTRWMRNFPTRFYGYKMIKIVNPNISENVISNLGLTKHDSLKKPVFLTAAKFSEIEINTDNKHYKPRDSVNVSVNLSNSPFKFSHFTISVAKKGAMNNELQKALLFSRDEESYFLKYLPEIYGNTISGTVNDPKNESAIEGADVSLAIIADTGFFAQTNSLADGSFYFSVPDYTGTVSISLQAKKDTIGLSVNTHDQFCSKKVFLDAVPFALSENEKNLAKEILINSQLNQKYYSPKQDEKSENGGYLSFYGIPDVTYLTEDYIEIPALDEFFFEIIPEVSIVNQKGKMNLFLAENNTFQMYPLLLMIDHTPVGSVQKFLNIRTLNIEKIEIIKHAYYVGNSSYSGIVHVFSKRGNRAGLPLPSNSYISEVEAFYPKKGSNQPVIEEVDKSRIADRRTTLFWEPNTQLGKHSTNMNFSFKTSDVTGEFEIKICGWIDNKPVCESKSIRVSKK